MLERVEELGIQPQNEGAIEYTRGVVKILNRKALENAACECYAVIRRITARNGLSHPRSTTRRTEN
jgi:hypothetical protein